MAAKRTGERPSGGRLIAENRGWLLYDLGGTGNGWAKVKLVSKVARQRANFTLSWHAESKALSRCSEAIALDVSLPEVYDWMVEELQA